jgi:hypothetical protein
MRWGRKALRGEAWAKTWMSNSEQDCDDEGGVDWLVMVEVIRAFRCPCTPYVSLLMMFLNLVPLTGRSAISLPS